MQLKLIRLTSAFKDAFMEMMDEWTSYNATHETNQSPAAIFKNDYHDFDYYRNHLDCKKDIEKGYVADSTFFCVDLDTRKMVGAVSIRHELNAYLEKYGGHIGDGIRPSFRRKGYATKMIALALEECKKLNIKKVLMCCDCNNIGSKKSIINNGGILENEVIEDDGNHIQRYWINNE